MIYVRFQMKVEYKKIPMCVAFTLVLFFFSYTLALAQFDPAQTFDKKCSSCHSIGGGVIKGPDLQGVNARYDQQWLIRFIQSSYEMIKAGDPKAVKIYNEFNQQDMPDQRLSDDEVIALLEFIDNPGMQQAAGSDKSVTLATQEDIDMGRALFFGQVQLSQGGPTCVSCHNVGQGYGLGGGTLAKDLTHVYSNYKDQGMSTALKKVGFPIMQEVYAKHKLNDQEVFAIKAFLYNEDLKSSPASGNDKKFLFLGLGGLVLAMGLIDFSWRRRRTKSVRRFRGGLR